MLPKSASDSNRRSRIEGLIHQRVRPERPPGAAEPCPVALVALRSFYFRQQCRFYEDCMSDDEIREALLAEPLVKSDREPDAVPDRAARSVETNRATLSIEALRAFRNIRGER